MSAFFTTVSDELIARDKASLDVFWLKDKSRDDLPSWMLCSSRSSII